MVERVIFLASAFFIIGLVEGFSESDVKYVSICHPYQDQVDKIPIYQRLRVLSSSALQNECCKLDDGPCISNFTSVKRISKKSIIICLASLSGLAHDVIDISAKSNLTSECCPGYQMENSQCVPSEKNYMSFITDDILVLGLVVTFMLNLFLIFLLYCNGRENGEVARARSEEFNNNISNWNSVMPYTEIPVARYPDTIDYPGSINDENKYAVPYGTINRTNQVINQNSHFDEDDYNNIFGTVATPTINSLYSQVHK